MDYKLAQKLLDVLVRNCPVDSGALKQSITIIQFDEKNFTIQIGNESGKEINGSSATNVYASITNQRTLSFKTKRGTFLRVVKRNPNYHWVNNSIQQWIQENKLDLSIMADSQEEEEDEEIE